MKQSLFLLFCICIGFGQENSILGFWKPENKDAIIQIYKENDRYFGKVVKHKKKGVVSVPQKDIFILQEFIFQKDEQIWNEGILYSPEREREFDAELEINADGNLEVTVSIAFFSKSVTWYKQVSADL